MTHLARYVQRPRKTQGISYAARYEPGCALDDIQTVAFKAAGDAVLAEVPELRVLVVRFLRACDDYPAKIDYVIVEAGDYLVYSGAFDLLYGSDPEAFARDYEPVST